MLAIVTYKASYATIPQDSLLYSYFSKECSLEFWSPDENIFIINPRLGGLYLNDMLRI